MKDPQVKLEKKLLDAFLGNHPGDAARAMSAIKANEAAKFLEYVKPRSAAKSLQKAPAKMACKALEKMQVTSAAKILQQLPFDTQLVFLLSLNPKKREAILGALPNSHAAKLRRLLHYPVGSAGYFMDPSPLSVLEDCLVDSALEQIRRQPDADRHYVYVTDIERRLVGIVTLQALFNAQHQEKVASIMNTEFAHLPARASERDIIKHPYWRDFHELPVINRHGVLLGVIRYETLNRLKADRSPDESTRDSLGTVIALSELYWLGMTGFLDTISAPANGEHGSESIAGKTDAD